MSIDYDMINAILDTAATFLLTSGSRIDVFQILLDASADPGQKAVTVKEVEFKIRDPSMQRLALFFIELFRIAAPLGTGLYANQSHHTLQAVLFAELRVLLASQQFLIFFKASCKGKQIASFQNAIKEQLDVRLKKLAGSEDVVDDDETKKKLTSLYGTATARRMLNDITVLCTISAEHMKDTKDTARLGLRERIRVTVTGIFTVCRESQILFWKTLYSPDKYSERGAMKLIKIYEAVLAEDRNFASNRCFPGNTERIFNVAELITSDLAKDILLPYQSVSFAIPCTIHTAHYRQYTTRYDFCK
jgi:hypothetical protein